MREQESEVYFDAFPFSKKMRNNENETLKCRFVRRYFQGAWRYLVWMRDVAIDELRFFLSQLGNVHTNNKEP